MELYLTYHKVLDKLELFQQNYCCLNSFGYGNLVDFGKNVSGQTVTYPYLFIVPLSVSYDQNTTTYQLSAIFADRLNESLDNEKDAVSDMSLAARQLLSEIWRGNLQDYFDAPLPVNGQPFMERFNDYVAGIAIDLNLTVMEDINACEQWIISPLPSPTTTATPTVTPTPSETPNKPTPSVTPTMTNTPTITPTITNTPSTTPPPQNNPAALNALWWIDFTKASSLSLNVPTNTSVSAATDQIASVIFTVEDGVPSNGPMYYPTGYLGVSGMTVQNASPLSNPLGTYTAHHNGFTWFGYMDNDNVSPQRGGCWIEGYDGTGFPTGTRFFFIRDLNTPPNVFYANARLNGGGSLQVGFDLSTTGWTAIAIRAYEQSGDAYLEVWENDSLISSTSQAGASLYTLSDQQYRLMFDGGLDGNTEQFYFDKKLNNSQLSQMFTYLNNKY